VTTEAPSLDAIGRDIRARVEKLNQLGSKSVDMIDSINHLLGQAEKLCGPNAFESFKETYCPELKQSRMYALLAVREGSQDPRRNSRRDQSAGRQAPRREEGGRCNGKRFRYIGPSICLGRNAHRAGRADMGGMD
jgi:hypothetical protein